jgi:hypothetical protein
MAPAPFVYWMSCRFEMQGRDESGDGSGRIEPLFQQMAAVDLKP